MNWRLLLTLGLLAAAVGTGWLVWLGRDDEAPEPTGQQESDYVLHDFELIALDREGRESFTLRAPRLARRATGRTIDIATPLFVIPPAQGRAAPWEIRAATGWVSPKGEELRLRGQVSATSRTADGRPVRMRTEQLNVFPDARRATSAVAVTVTQPGLILSGRGLEAMLDAKRVTLKNDVQARYERTP